jgi:protocatechuate 3,4-dioxygenase beta subunit
MTPPNIFVPSRRNFCKGLALAAAYMSVRGAFAEALMLTPKQTEGPFYPDHLPLDTDNDLIVVNDDATPAVGTITWVSGKILDRRGDPIRNALVEIWQCDNNGAYIHSGTTNKNEADNHFQGFGRFLTGASGEYLFRTIKPVPYPGRTPHIHFAIKMKGHEKWTTQCYIQGHPGNEKDGIWKSINAKDRDLLTVPFTPIASSKAGEQAAKFDIVMGYTPEV